MVEQSALFSIIQFVGLITPAIAIVTELVIRFHGGVEKMSEERMVPVEVQILFIGFIAIVFGGMLVGFRLLTTISDGITRASALLIFGGLPFVAVSLLLMNVRISTNIDTDVGAIVGAKTIGTFSFSILLPTVLNTIIYVGAVYWASGLLDFLFGWWIFAGTVPVVWFFYLIALLIVFKSVYSVWRQNLIPSRQMGAAVQESIVVSIVASLFLFVVSGPVFALNYALVNFGGVIGVFVAPESIIASIPFIWTLLVLMLVLAIPIDSGDD